MKTRNDLAAYFGELGFRVGAEVGVESGLFSEVICQANPGVKLFCIDAWERYDGYDDYKLSSTFKKMYDTTVKRLAPYNYTIIKKFSVDAAKDFGDGSLDFVYIDANHDYEHAKEDINVWSPKVRSGGIVSGHDYIEAPSRNQGVIKAVDEYVAEHGYTLQITSTGKPGDHRAPSWYFVKI